MPASTPAPRTRRRYRQLQAVILGAVFTLGLALFAAAAWSSGDRALALGTGAFAPLVFAVLVWPSVQLDEKGVLIRNIVTDTRLPWHLIDDCSTRWNLEVWTLTKGYTAWAISASRRGAMPEHHMMTAGLNPMVMGRPAKVQAAAEAAAERHSGKVHAGSVANAIEHAKVEYDQLVADGTLPAGTGEVVRRVSPVPVTLLALSAALMVAWFVALA